MVAVELPAPKVTVPFGGRKGRGACLRVVVRRGAKSGRAADREVDRQRAAGDANAREGVDEIRRAVLSNRTRSDCDRHVCVVVGDRARGGIVDSGNVVASACRHCQNYCLVRLDGGVRLGSIVTVAVELPAPNDTVPVGGVKVAAPVWV